jgi:hypothetical protein
MFGQNIWADVWRGGGLWSIDDSATNFDCFYSFWATFLAVSATLKRLSLKQNTIFWNHYSHRYYDYVIMGRFSYVFALKQTSVGKFWLFGWLFGPQIVDFRQQTSYSQNPITLALTMKLRSCVMGERSSTFFQFNFSLTFLPFIISQQGLWINKSYRFLTVLETLTMF